MAQYFSVNFIEFDNTKLVQQERTDLTPPYSCVSWREKRPSSGTNRRFYCEQCKYWRIPISQALDMMRQANQEGFFGDVKSEPGMITEKFIIDPKDHNYHDMIGLVLVDSSYDEEWHGCSAVMCVQSDKKWRKVMIVSFDTGYATFRSLSCDNSYSFFYSDLTADGWRLDKAMLDAHPIAFVNWLEYLESKLS